MGKFRENFVCFPKFSHFFLKMGELFAHFERKMGFFGETYKISTKFSHDFSQCLAIEKCNIFLQEHQCQLLRENTGMGKNINCVVEGSNNANIMMISKSPVGHSQIL